MPSRSIIRTGVGPHREPGNRFPAMVAAINLLAARAARVQSRRNLSRSLSPKLDHSHSITRFDRSRTGPKMEAVDLFSTLPSVQVKFDVICSLLQAKVLRSSARQPARRTGAKHGQ